MSDLLVDKNVKTFPQRENISRSDMDHSNKNGCMIFKLHSTQRNFEH